MRREESMGEPGREATRDQVRGGEEGGRRPGRAHSIIAMPGTASPSGGMSSSCWGAGVQK